MSVHVIDRDKLRLALRKLSDKEIYFLLSRAVEMLPAAKLQRLVRGHLDMARLCPGDYKPDDILAEARTFEKTSLRGEYYESFDVNYKNCTELSKGTRAWISEFHHLLDRCIAAARRDDKDAARGAFEICFGLLRHIDECLDDVIFFADEGGSWQVGVDWRRVLRAWFRCLSATSQPEEYGAQVLAVVDEFEHYARDKHLSAARRVATPAQRKALSALMNRSATERTDLPRPKL
jgi:hypothetical protein